MPREFYITYNKGRSQGKDLLRVYNDETKDMDPRKRPPRIFNSYADAKKVVDELERRSMFGDQMTAYWVSDENMEPIKENKLSKLEKFNRLKEIIQSKKLNEGFRMKKLR